MLISYGNAYFDDVTGDVYEDEEREDDRDWDDECDRIREGRYERGEDK